MVFVTSQLCNSDLLRVLSSNYVSLLSCELLYVRIRLGMKEKIGLTKFLVIFTS
jgi:hypothetical protein